MFFACGIWCLADVLSVSPSSEQTICVVILSFLEKTPYSKIVINLTETLGLYGKYQTSIMTH